MSLYAVCPSSKYKPNHKVFRFCFELKEQVIASISVWLQRRTPLLGNLVRWGALGLQKPSTQPRNEKHVTSWTILSNFMLKFPYLKSESKKSNKDSGIFVLFAISINYHLIFSCFQNWLNFSGEVKGASPSLSYGFQPTLPSFWPVLFPTLIAILLHKLFAWSSLGGMLLLLECSSGLGTVWNHPEQ